LKCVPNFKPNTSIFVREKNASLQEGVGWWHTPPAVRMPFMYTPRLLIAAAWAPFSRGSSSMRAHSFFEFFSPLCVFVPFSFLLSLCFACFCFSTVCSWPRRHSPTASSAPRHCLVCCWHCAHGDTVNRLVVVVPFFC